MCDSCLNAPASFLPFHSLTRLPLLLDDGERLRLIEENARDYAIIVLDTDGHIVNWNPAAERILQWREAEVQGQRCALIFTPEDIARSADWQELRTAVDTGRSEDDRWHVKKDGSRFWASGIMTALRDEAGNLRGYVKIVRDATERKQLEAVARRERAAAEAAERALQQANARLELAMTETHHRVKNSLNLIAGLVDMRAADGAETVTQDELKTLETHIRSLASLHDLLTQRAKQDGEASALLSSQDVLEKLMLLLQATAPNRRIDFEIEDAALSTKQASSLSLITNEVVSNALKHSQGNVRVVFWADDKTAVLQVSDDGDGFGDGFDSAAASHTGLELIEHLTRHDLSGHIEYANRPEGGGRVRVCFPLAGV